MRSIKIIGLVAAFVVGSAGLASAQVNNCGNNAFAGTAIGAVIGGTAGGVIANDIRGFNRRGFNQRGFRRGGFGRAGFGPGFNGRGFNSFGSRGFRGRRGNGALGAVIGAVVGGVAGSQIAAARQQNCIRRARRAQQAAHTSGGFTSPNGAPIDHNARRLGDPYGGQAVTPSQPVGYTPPQPSQTAPHPSSIVTNPVASDPICCTGAGPSTTTQNDPLLGGSSPTCQILDRRTTLPDGTIVSEPVEYCQFSPGGDWVPR